jgi:hypothetical protein
MNNSQRQHKDPGMALGASSDERMNRRTKTYDLATEGEDDTVILMAGGFKGETRRCGVRACDASFMQGGGLQEH